MGGRSHTLGKREHGQQQGGHFIGRRAGDWYRKDLDTVPEGHQRHQPDKGQYGPLAGRVLNIIGQPLPDAARTRLEILCREGAEK